MLENTPTLMYGDVRVQSARARGNKDQAASVELIYSTTANARTGNVPNSFTLTGTA